MNPSNYLKIKNKIPSNVNILAVSKGFKSQDIKTIQNLIKSASVRSINFRTLGFKKTFNVFLILVERLFQNIFLRIDQGAESLLSKKKIIIKTNRFRTSHPSKSLNVIFNTISICFICIAIFLRKLYGAL